MFKVIINVNDLVGNLVNTVKCEIEQETLTKVIEARSKLHQ